MAQYMQINDFSVPAHPVIGDGNKKGCGPMSLYIPSVHRTVQHHQLDSLFRHLGQITRVDWVEFAPMKSNFKRAYIHFDNCNLDNLPVGFPETPYTLVYQIQDFSTVEKYMSCAAGNGPKYSMTILPASNPVPPTTLNIHQVANNLKIFEETVWGDLHRKEEVIRNQAELIEELQNQLKNQAAMIHALLTRPMYPSPPRLERHSNRHFAFDDVINAPFKGEKQEQEDDKISEESIDRLVANMRDWPSTAPPSREISLNIDLIEDSISTHDSMPELTMLNRVDSWDEPACDATVVVTNENV